METQTNSIPSDVIATAAYYEWLKAGQPTGRDQEFWLLAENQLRSFSKPGLDKPVNGAKKPTKGAAKAVKL